MSKSIHAASLYKVADMLNSHLGLPHSNLIVYHTLSLGPAAVKILCHTDQLFYCLPTVLWFKKHIALGLVAGSCHRDTSWAARDSPTGDP